MSPCVAVVQLCADVTCANGGTCEDTMSGFKCHCIFGHYNGLMCENGEWYTLTFNVETTRDMSTCVEYLKVLNRSRSVYCQISFLYILCLCISTTRPSVLCVAVGLDLTFQAFKRGAVLVNVCWLN